jgi:uncharacterized membrane protein YdjX (TVP38/TMEM64 family)
MENVMQRRWVKPTLIIVVAAGAAWLAVAVWDHEALVEWLRRASPLWFFTLMAALPLLGVPLLPLLVLAGASFGAGRGALGSLAALAANLVASWGIAHALRPAISAVAKRLGYALPVASSAQNPIRRVLVVKLTPAVPAFVKNYALAMSGVGFVPYFGLSMLVSGAYAVAVVALGGSLFDHDANTLAPVAIAIAAVGVAVWRWRRRQRMG